VRIALLLTALVVVTATATATAGPSDPGDAPHLLSCAVKDTIRPAADGTLVREAPLPPGARAIGRLTSFVVDPVTGVVRLPGLGDIGWTLVKGRDATEPEIILTPVTRLDSATSISIHIRRSGDAITFLFFEVERVMSGTCTLLP
jgi:hypothetical protein